MTAYGDFPQDALKQLVVKHALLFHGKIPEGSHLPVGWLPLTSELCAALEAILGDRCAEFAVLQIKEKWAGLRFYWAIEGLDTQLDADTGGVRPKQSEPSSGPDERGLRRRVTETHFGLRTTLSPDTPLANAIVDRIGQAEALSTVTCELCGAPGQLWVAGHGGPGFHYTACDLHKGDDALSKGEWLARLAGRRAQVIVDADVIRALLEVGADMRKVRAWYGKPLDVFDGRTPRQLIAAGRKADLLRYVDSIAAGPAG